MHSTASLVKRLAIDFPDIHFMVGGDFRWSAEESTIYYPDKSTHAASLLHELAHSLLGHTDYSRDIQLLEMERDAWEYATVNLGPRYDTTVADTDVQHALDSYRDWVHARSSCPVCHATGYQTKKQRYSCAACGQPWRVNEARLCRLKRYSMKI